MQPVVTTAQGKLRGAAEKGAAVFLGIPYAAAPQGEGRFAPPGAVPRWEGIRDALAYGATALQPHQEFTLIPEPLVDGENPLNLNVFTPDPGTAGLPVMVWIHGGGFFAGCNASPWYRGETFARDGVVLVSINYRLGLEGFLEVEGGLNRGVLDWLAALEWVHDNIGAFGGDPSNVTVAGQSAGGVAAMVLAAMPRAEGLIRRALSMSGPIDLVGTAEQAHETTRRLAEYLGTTVSRSSLSELPIARLLEAQAVLMPGGAPDLETITDTFGAFGLPLVPCVDGDLIPHGVIDAFGAGIGSSIDVLAGTTTEEFSMMFARQGNALDDAGVDRTLERLGLAGDGPKTYRELLPGRSPGVILGQALTDLMFRVPSAHLGEARTGTTGATYLYESAWRSTAMDGILGAVHCVDIPFAFDNLDAPGVEAALGAKPPQQLAERMHRAFVQFAAEGDPGWPAYDLDRRPTMVFDAKSAIVDDPARVERTLWGRHREPSGPA